MFNGEAIGDAAGIKAPRRIALIPDGLNLIGRLFSLVRTIRRPTVLMGLFVRPPNVFQYDARNGAPCEMTSDDLPIAAPQTLNELS